MRTTGDWLPATGYGRLARALLRADDLLEPHGRSPRRLDWASWVGNALAGHQYDCTFVPNRCRSVKRTTTRNWKGKRTPGDPGEVDVLLALPKGKPTAPKDVQARRYGADAVRITWTDTTDRELGFRVDRRIGGGKWHTIAYRPRQSKRHPRNPAAWIDFTARCGKDLTYRVLACDGEDSDDAASPPTKPIRLP